MSKGRGACCVPTRTDARRGMSGVAGVASEETVVGDAIGRNKRRKRENRIAKYLWERKRHAKRRAADLAECTDRSTADTADR